MVRRFPSRARRGAYLLVREGILRPPPRPSKPLASAAIRQLRAGDHVQPGSGAFARDLTAAELVRGGAVLAAMARLRIGGACFGFRHATNRGTRHLLVVAAGETARLDATMAAVGAAGLAVMAPPGSAVARRAQRAGCRLAEPGDDPWPFLNGQVTVHGDPEAEIVLLARMLGLAAGGAGRPDAALAAAHLVVGARYADPETGQRLSCEAFLDRLAAWHARRVRMPPVASMVGISFWKRQRMREMLGDVPHAGSAREAVRQAAARGGWIAVWPSRSPAGLDRLAAAAGVPVCRVEDGFIRSNGLGSDFIAPASVVLDRHGLYYDTSHRNDLEELLAGYDFTMAMLQRARALIDRIVAGRVSKYNLAGGGQGLPDAAGRRRIFVPGQVSDDQSVRAAACGVQPGCDLLARVRAAAPDAFIAYKPHPDVEAGHRKGRISDAAALHFADAVVRDAPVWQLIDWADEVHTLTSLTGFEALLRGRPVTCWGRPFYAGWGLTTDRAPGPQRRSLSVEALAAATLILYPYYIDPVTLLPCEPERLLDRLMEPGAEKAQRLVRLRRAQGKLRRLAPRLAGLL